MSNIADLLQKHESLIKRYENNPILSPSNWQYEVNAVFNPAAIEFEGETLLLVRVEGMDGFSHLTAARSKDGKTNWRIDSEPTWLADPENYPEEIWGIEDPRVVRLEESDTYAVVYTAFSKDGPQVALALTKDFKTFEKHGIIMTAEDKDASLFPRKINGRWALLHRPSPIGLSTKANIWISFSPDLKYWGEHTMVLEARDGGWWDAGKIGLGPQPIETPEGWMLIYHGVRNTFAGSIYRIGLAMLDLDDPTKVIRRGRNWVLGPREIFETHGDVGYVTFPSGVIWDKDTDELRIYYGAADTFVGLATAKMGDVVDYLMNSPECRI
ncbi:glycosidase [bacterium]|nr:glycosidase [bacterium]